MVEWKTLDAGAKMITQSTGAQASEFEVGRFTDRLELLAYLTSVGQKGRQVLAFVGLRSTAADSIYNDVLTLLDGHFNKEEPFL